MTETSPNVAERQATSPLEQYRAHLVQGHLAFQIDEDGQALFYPRVAAPADYRGALRWATTTHISPKGESAYNVALIDMDEGFRLMSRVESIPADQVCIGMRVKVRIRPAEGDEGPYPVFDPVEAA